MLSSPFTPWTSRERVILLLLAITSVITVVFGWRIFYFLTDDAYIAFRYVSNSFLGHGYVWNPAPFRPVEGYTSFLWVVLLDMVWRVFGITPPDSANTLALIFTCLQLLLAAIMVLKWPGNADYYRWRLALLSIILLGVTTNRTFLAWASSGLETALFNFLVLLWVISVLKKPRLTRSWLAATTTATMFLTLARPDGILFSLVTFGLVLPGLFAKAADKKLHFLDFLSTSPLLAVPMHFIWRRVVYGEWLPNTYYAKMTSPGGWVDSGWRYATSFAIEYSLWIWMILVCLTLITGLRGALHRIRIKLFHTSVLDFFSLQPQNKGATPRGSHLRFSLVWLVLLAVLCGVTAILAAKTLWGVLLLALVGVAILLVGAFGLDIVESAVILALMGHWAYYTFIIGGDHFEFRVYSHLIALLLVSLPWLTHKLGLKASSSLAILSLAVFLSWPIPWIHYVATRNLTTRDQTKFLKTSVADQASKIWPGIPSIFAAYLRSYDNLQSWLISHAVCIRHQEHKVFHLYMTEILPSREIGSALGPQGFPVFEARSSGIVAWVLPHVFIIDRLGLSDFVIAHNPDLSGGRIMAHERKPPPGYVECFMPNVRIKDKQSIVDPRHEELNAEHIVACEQRFVQGIKAK